MPHPILLYDGVCGLCNRFVQFILRRDADAVFRFGSLQSPLARQILARHGADPADLDTVYVVLSYDLPDERLLPRSDAVIFILRNLGARRHTLGHLLQLVPRPLRDWGYRIVARNRYRIFGKYDACFVPDEGFKARVIE